MDQATPVVTTTVGPISGALVGENLVAARDSDRSDERERREVARFLGVPYAAPPVGELRFRAPQPHPPWSETRFCLTYGDSSVQRGSGPSPGPLGTPEGVGTSEDCLVLNVWSPDLNGSAPVMVWFHGGGYAVGTASSPLYDGANLAARNDVVVVSVNHRLGLLGFLDVSRRLGPGYEQSANAGMLDLVAALEWVRDNIAAFGGDPDRVTLFGESGGGGKVSALLAMPSAAGLYHRAIIQSGPPFQFPDPDQAHATSGKVLAELGWSDGEAHRLLDVPAERLLEVQIALGAGGGPSPGGMSFAPTVGTEALPDWPGPSVRAGMAADIPLLIGTNEHEAWFMTLMDPRMRDGGGGPEISDAELVERLAPGVDAGLEGLIAHYQQRLPERSNFEILLTIESEAFRVRSLRLAEAKAEGGGAPVFAYLFRRIASKLAHGGSYHGLEMGFMFDNLHTMGFTLADDGSEQLAREMSARWAAFARTGRPDIEGLPRWEPFEGQRRATMEIDQGWTMVDDPLADDRRAWNEVPLGPRTRPWSRIFG